MISDIYNDANRTRRPPPPTPPPARSVRIIVNVLNACCTAAIAFRCVKYLYNICSLFLVVGECGLWLTMQLKRILTVNTIDYMTGQNPI